VPDFVRTGRRGWEWPHRWLRPADDNNDHDDDNDRSECYNDDHCAERINNHHTTNDHDHHDHGSADDHDGGGAVVSQDSLFELQRLDTESEVLNHRRVNLEQRTVLEAALVEQAGHQVEIDAVAAARVEVATRQRRHEDEAQIVATKVESDEARLYSGEVQGVKDLEALQHEIGSLKERQEGFEDLALEAMEEAEGLAARISSLEAARADVDARIATLRDEITVAEAEIDAEIERTSLARAAAAAETTPELVAEYEHLRPGFGSATVVRFDGSNCAGCPSSMPAMEVDRMKHEASGSVLNCHECGRIVLR